MSDVRQIVYVSSAFPKYTDEQLSDILSVARENNQALDVTGLLIYADGSIMQAIEGPPDTIGKLAEIIEADKRHTQFRILIDLEAQERAFPEWRMAFAHPPDATNLDQCMHLFLDQAALQADMRDKGIVGKLLSSFMS